ncbi:MAG: tRNA threonylcarbamoyladenosine dehydratase [Clostridia bacterium]|nr:tRNA threonylcarbamoyladenosine dehydratase [Clostridia bacterium]
MFWYERTRMLLGNEAVYKLKNASVIIFGVGGVGSFVAEAVARAGVGKITLADNDKVSLTNINRQIVALNSTVGKMKTEVMAERIRDINPECDVKCVNEFILYDNINDVINEKFDYCVDAVDTVTAKLAIIMKCDELNIPVISSMGTGNKLDPTMLEITDIYKTSVCPLAKVMRKELKVRGIKKLKVCYSKEEPVTPLESEEVTSKRRTPGSVSFVPSAAGLIIGGEVVKGIVN